MDFELEREEKLEEQERESNLVRVQGARQEVHKAIVLVEKAESLVRAAALLSGQGDKQAGILNDARAHLEDLQRALVRLASSIRKGEFGALERSFAKLEAAQ